MDFFTYAEDGECICLDVADIVTVYTALKSQKDKTLTYFVQLRSGPPRFLSVKMGEALFAKLRSLDSMYYMVDPEPEWQPAYMGDEQ